MEMMHMGGPGQHLVSSAAFVLALVALWGIVDAYLARRGGPSAVPLPGHSFGRRWLSGVVAGTIAATAIIGAAGLSLETPGMFDVFPTRSVVDFMGRAIVGGCFFAVIAAAPASTVVSLVGTLAPRITRVPVGVAVGFLVGILATLAVIYSSPWEFGTTAPQRVYGHLVLFCPGVLAGAVSGAWAVKGAA
jgi:hypothetical protein